MLRKSSLMTKPRREGRSDCHPRGVETETQRIQVRVVESLTLCLVEWLEG